MQCVLMAAGRGIRFGNRTQALPKTLIPLQGKPLFHYILEGCFQFVPPSQWIVVGGFEAPQIKEALGKYQNEVKFVINENFQHGNLLTLLAAKKYINDSFFVFNADHLYSDQILKKVFKTFEKPTAFCDRDRLLGLDDMKVKKNATGSLQEMKKALAEFEMGYVGISHIPKECLNLYWENADLTLKEKGLGVCIEEVLNRIARDHPVNLQDISGSTWIELDDERDLERAQSLLPKVLGDK